MKIEAISPSAYGTHNGCELRFFIEQRLKIRDYKSFKATDIGTIFHKIAEIFALISVGQKKGEPYIQDDEFGEISTKDFNVDEITAMVYNGYVERLPHHKWQPKDFKDVKKYVNTILNDHNGQYNPLKSDIIGIEHPFLIQINEPWAKLNDDNYFAIRGFIDLITKIDDNTIEIIDYKSGKREDFHTGKEKTYETLHNDIQLLMYYYASRIHFPEYEHVLVTIYYLKAGGPFTICFSEKDIVKTEQMLRQKFEKIKATEIPRPNKTWKCHQFCPFSKLKFEEPMIEWRDGQFQVPGEQMCICSQTDLMNRNHGIEWVEQHYKKENK